MRKFLWFANIKLNPSKCEVFKVTPAKDKSPSIVIANTEKEYLPKASFIKYLGVPLAGKR
jgi:hypothetical protein